ncbi:MAG: Hsp70 family protein, partial [Chlamydiia bacterium]|nr:Hsp70 family protein [Chlamydiia bacterium]
VSFDIDANGILHVHAKDKGTGKEQSIRITAPTKLSDEEIDKMVKEAEQYAEEDKKKKEEVEIRNKGDSLIFQAEKALKDYKDKIPDHLAKEIQTRIDNVKKTLEGTDIGAINASAEELNTYIQKIGEEIQKQGGAQPGAEGGMPPPPRGEAPGQEPPKDDHSDIEEAEVEILDEDDK